MTDRRKRRVAIAVATMLGVTVSASLSARYANQPIWPERTAPTGAMCLELKDSPESAELKTKYERAVETQKQAEADLAAAQEAVTAQRKRLSELREEQRQVAADCAAALSEQRQAEWTANTEAQRQAAVVAQRQALEAAEKQQAEWQAAMTAQQQTMRQAQQKAAEDAQNRQAEWQERSKAATAEGQYGPAFDTSGYPVSGFRAPFEPPQPPAYGELPGREWNYLPLPGDPTLMDWDYEPQRLGFLDGDDAGLRKEMMEAHQRRRDEMENRRYATNERLDALRRERPYGSARFYQRPDRSLAEMCETLSDKRD